MLRLRIARLGLSCMTFLCVPGIALAQSSTGIGGIVKDTSGAVMPGVTVEASSPVLIEKVRSVVTDTQGLYSIVDLRPGTYSVTFTLPGFATVRHEGIELTASFTATVNAELQVGAVQETVTVSGEAPTVDIHNVVQQRVLSDATREALPNGRSILFMALTVPGMTNTGGIKGTGQDVLGASDTRGQSFIHGGRSGDYRMELDGAMLNTTAIQSNPGETQEYVYELGAVTAESESGGVRANMIPKEGGNRYAGTLFGAYLAGESNNITPALVLQGIPTPNKYLYDRDLNFSGGGPISRDHLWFFSSFRYFADEQQVAGMFFAIYPLSFTFNPALGAAGNADVSRPAYNLGVNKWFDNRLTWQATHKNKLALYVSEQPRYTDGTFVTGTRSMEAGRSHRWNHNQVVQISWKSPATSKLLVETTWTDSFMGGAQGEPVSSPGLSSSNVVSVTDSGTGYTYRASSNGYSYDRYHAGVAKAAVSYVTGAHVAKVGILAEWGTTDFTQNNFHTQGMTFSFKNGAATQITVFNDPFSINPLYHRWALFAQDQWKVKRLTFNAGLRFDLNRESVSDQITGPNAFAPLQHWPDLQNVPNWKDLSPRLGAVYDVFGNGKTALKATLSRYVVSDGTSFVSSLAPSAFNRSATESWTDSNHDFIPDAGDVIGTLSNPAFATGATTTTVDPTLRQGWGVRPYEWEWSVGVQHQLLRELAVNFAFTHRQYYNLNVTNNLALNPGDYDEYCLTAPTDTRLGSVSASQICGLYDLNPQFKSLTPNNLITHASKYGTDTEIYNGLDVGVTTRVARRLTLSGGLNAGPPNNNTSACFVFNSPQALRFCQTHYPWLTAVRANAAVNLPWDINAGVSFQTIPGPENIANFTVTSSQIGSVVQFVNPARTSFANGSATVSLLAPGAQYNARLYQTDIRLAKIVKYQSIQARPTLDVGNLFNVSTALTQNTTYGTSWLRPNNLLPGRIFKLGLEITF